MPLTVEVLKKYRTSNFVETGTFVGNGVKIAIECGFRNIYSVELSEKLYRDNVERFKDFKNVNLFCGSSEETLARIIKDISGPITFWLDAHYSGGVTEMGQSNCPILCELEIIGSHPVRTHTILIDDIRLFGKNYLAHEELREMDETERKQFLFEDIEIATIQETILKTNNNYRFRYENGHKEADVLAAFIPKWSPLEALKKLFSR